MDLKNKVAIVTGGNGGLGQRICRALANAGCKIAVVYAKSKEQAEGVVEQRRGRFQRWQAWAKHQAKSPNEKRLSKGLPPVQQRRWGW